MIHNNKGTKNYWDYQLLQRLSYPELRLLGRKNIIIQYGYNGTEGNVVSWNNAIEIGGINENGNITRPTYIALGHELAHAVDQLYKKTEYGIWTKGPNSEDIPNTEKYATYIENEIRAEAKLPLRTHYAIIGNKGYEPTSNYSAPIEVSLLA